jgi:hypothetical protein
VALDAQVAALANSRMPSDAIDLDAWLAVGRRVRAWLLERLDAPPGPPAARIAALAARVFAVVPSSRGETRAQRWRDVLASRAGTRALVDSMAEYGAWHATMLHSLLVIADLLRASLAAFEGHDLDGYQPENIDPSGLLGTANDVVAHHLVLKAAICDNDALDLLARARVIAPRNELVLGCSNEARFRAGARDAALLSDLRSEQRARRSLACAAELLAVAEELGAKAHRLRADLLRLARGTPHAWIATARVTLARPQALASVERVQALLSETPSSRVDAKDRAGFALYGADPPAAVADLRRALETQRDALEWQALVAEIESEPKPAERGASDERSDEPRHRPRMPARGEPDSLARAMHALRVRLDRPAVGRSIPRRRGSCSSCCGSRSRSMAGIADFRDLRRTDIARGSR